MFFQTLTVPAAELKPPFFILTERLAKFLDEAVMGERWTDVIDASRVWYSEDKNGECSQACNLACLGFPRDPRDPWETPNPPNRLSGPYRAVTDPAGRDPWDPWGCL